MEINMIDSAIFSASYADWKIFKGRKVVSISFEVPLEKADEAYQVLGGMPNAGEEVWFAIARLQKPQLKEATTPNRLVQRAGILCADHGFQNFLQVSWPQVWTDTKGDENERAAQTLRLLCEIGSRRELSTNEKASARFEEITRRYEGWGRGIE